MPSRGLFDFSEADFLLKILFTFAKKLWAEGFHHQKEFKNSYIV